MMSQIRSRVECLISTDNILGRLKMREWKMREYRLAVWKAEPLLYSDTALS